MPIPSSELLSFPPPVEDLELAFGTTMWLPTFESLPKEYQEETAPGCIIASTIFSLGWFRGAEKIQEIYSNQIRVCGPPESYIFSKDEERDYMKRFHRCISAHLSSFEPKHEHKIAGVGYMIDRWLKGGHNDH